MLLLIIDLMFYLTKVKNYEKRLKITIREFKKENFQKRNLHLGIYTKKIENSSYMYQQNTRTK